MLRPPGSTRGQFGISGPTGTMPVRIERLDRVIAPLNMVDVDRFADAGNIKDPGEVGAQFRIVRDAAEIALE